MRLNNIIEYLLHPYNEGNIISCIFFFVWYAINGIELERELRIKLVSKLLNNCYKIKYQ